MWCGHDGVPDFEKLRSQTCNDDVFLYGFDLLELNGEDCRREPLEKRKEALGRLLAGQTGLRLSEHMEGDGQIMFDHACKMGLEGIVSKRRDLPYRSGRVKSWTMSMRCSMANLVVGSGWPPIREVGSEIRQPLGYAIVGGLALSQFLTLYNTPVVFLYLDRFDKTIAPAAPARVGGSLEPAPAD